MKSKAKSKTILCVRIGSLSEPLATYCEKNGIDESKVARMALAKFLKVKEPDLRVGNPNFKAASKASV